MVTTPQVWALIGILTTTLIAFVTLGIASVRQLFDAMNRRFDDLRSEMGVRFDRLDGDVQALTNRVFRDG